MFIAAAPASIDKGIDKLRGLQIHYFGKFGTSAQMETVLNSDPYSHYPHFPLYKRLWPTKH